MISEDRLDELATFILDDDTPPDAYIRLPARDVRDLVRLVAVVRAAIALREAVVVGKHHGAPSGITDLDVMNAVNRFDAERCAT